MDTVHIHAQSQFLLKISHHPIIAIVRFPLYAHALHFLTHTRMAINEFITLDISERRLV
jgi:hypothetical protein